MPSRAVSAPLALARAAGVAAMAWSATALPLMAEVGEHGWRCRGPVTVDDFQGRIERAFFKDEVRPYDLVFQLEAGRRIEAKWTIHARAKRPFWSSPLFDGRSEDEAFRDGPDSLSNPAYQNYEVVTPVWSHWWRDGVYAGAALEFSRSRSTSVSLGGGLFDDKVMKAVNGGRVASFTTVDRSGKVLLSGSYRLPDPARVQAQFKEAKARLLQAEKVYRETFQRLELGGITCDELEDPALSQ